jgi:hypothetical protein
METINITVKLSKHQVVKFQQFIEEHVEVLDFKILPDTQKMWDEDEVFQSIVKEQKKHNKLVSKYINDNNNKYKIK